MKAVIFDFDGLIVDTETPAFTAWCEIYRSYGVELLKEDWVQVVGTTYSRFHPVDHLNKLTGLSLDRDELTARKEERKGDLCEAMPALPGVRERIEEARDLGLAIGLASTSLKDWVDYHLQRVALSDHFPVRITRELVNKVKPDPEPYLKTMSELGVEASQTVIFEDSLNGVTAAKAAGATCIVVPNSVTAILDFPAADKRVNSLQDVRLADLV